MDMSIFLAKLFGFMMLTMAVGILFNHKYFMKMLNDFMKSPATMYVAGFVTFLLGLCAVLMHNVWEGSFEVVVTLMGWLILLKGVVYMVAPAHLVKMGKSMMTRSWMHFGVVANLGIGLYLLYAAYYLA